MQSKTYILVAVTILSLVPACVSSKQTEDGDVSNLPLDGKSYGILDREDEVYPWLASQYDKGIYASSAQTAPFRDNALTTENLKRRIQKTSKKAKK